MKNTQLEKFKQLEKTVKDPELKANIKKKIEALEGKKTILKS